jgi:CBS domain-containing protein
MTESPVCCEPQTPLHEAARLMAEHDCGELPVVDDMKSMHPIGVVTDRDICCRAVAQRMDVETSTVESCMSSPAVSVKEDTDLERCIELLEKNQIRRIPVVDDSGRICGIVAQADIARYTEDREAADVLRAVSRKSNKPSSVNYDSMSNNGVTGPARHA